MSLGGYARRTLVVTGVVLGCLLLLAVLIFVTPVGTRLGARAALALAAPAGLSIGAVEGTLAGGLVLRDLRYADAAVTAMIERVALEAAWQPLVGGRLELERLDIEGGSITFAPSADAADAPPPQPPALPAIPRELAVQRFSARDIEVAGLADSPVAIGRIEGALDGPALTLDTVVIEAARAELVASGTAMLADSASVSIDAAIVLPVAADAVVPVAADDASPLRVAADVELEQAAEPAAAPLAMSLRATIRGGALPDDASVEGNAVFANGVLSLERLAIDTLEGTIRVSGTAASDLARGRLSIAYEGLDPALLDDRISGRLDGALDLDFDRRGGELMLAADAVIGGSLGGRALDGNLAARLDGETLTVRRGELVLGDNAGHIAIDGAVGPETADLTLSARLPALEAWYPPAAGAIEASGRISGRPDDPRLELDVTARGLALEAAAMPTIDELVIGVSGTRADHRISARLQSEAGRSSLTVEQGVTDKGVEGRLLDLAVASPEAGEWTLAGPAAYSASQTLISLASTCLAGPAAAHVCVSVGESALELEADGLQMALLDPWLPAELSIAGAADLNAEIDWAVALTGSFEISVASLRLAGRPERASELAAIENLALRGRLTPDRLTATLGATIAATGDSIEGSIEVTPPAADGALTAALSASLTDLTLIDALSDDVEDLEGSLAAELTAGGTPAAPALNGMLAVESLSARLPPLGIAVEDTRVDVTAESVDVVSVDARICSEGCIDVAGTLEIGVPEAAWRLTAAASGRRFLLADLPELRVAVSPDLDLSATPQSLGVTGDLAVTEGLVVVETVPESAVRPVDETIVHGRAETLGADGRAAPIAIDLDVDATLGQVRFEGLGIVADLDGALEIDQAGNGPLSVRGTTTVDEGTFTAYGQTLTIDGGQLIFTGAYDNPSLDIRATREVEGGTVGLVITGTARNPRSVVFSEPALSESEALARLVTGRSLDGASEADAASIERAALGLGIRRALPALERIGGSLGLDELGVDAPGGAEGALVAGKQLGEDVYLRYKHGLFDDFAGLELVYRITERFRLRTETGTAQSIDLIYEVDSGDEAALAEQAGEGIGEDGESPGEIAASE